MFLWLQRLFSSSHQKIDDGIPDAIREMAAPAMDEKAIVISENASALSGKNFASTEKILGASWQQRDDVNANFSNWLFDAHDNSDLDTNQVEMEILDALDKIVKSKQSGADLVRRMPGLLPQLLQSLRTENFSGADLSRKISHDVVLVAAVIRLANSSLYNPSQTITSIEHAVLVLGQRGLRQLITSVAFRPIIDMNSAHFTKMVAPRIWDQSERCAIANRTLAPAENVDPFEAFLAGLIQNVGLIVALRFVDQMAESSASLGSACFCTSLLDYARTLSCSIGKEWNFPAAVTTAIEEQGTVFNTAAMSPMGRLLSLGDYVSKVRILVDSDRLTEGDPRLLKGLSTQTIRCYKELDSTGAFESASAEKN